MKRVVGMCLICLLAAVSANAQDPTDPAVYRDRGAWLAAVAAAGITPRIGTQTFETQGMEGSYSTGLPDPGGTVRFSTADSSAVSVARVKDGHVLRPQVSAFIDASPFLLQAIGFDLQLEPALPCPTPSNSAYVILTMTGRSLPPQYAAIATSQSFIGFVAAEGTRIVNVLVFSINPVCGNGDAITLLDNVSYPGGAESSTTNPDPPVPCPPGHAADAFCFVAPDGPAWYDPPPTNAFDFSATDAKFISINDFPPGFGAPFTVTTGGVTLGSFTPGQRVDFPNGGVHEFRVSGISPAVDGSSPLAFPINLTLDQVGALFSMLPLTVTESTPPVITPSVNPAPLNGWNNSPVIVSWSVTDAESSVTAQTGCGDSSQGSDTAGTNFTCTATSGGGTDSKTVTVRLDQTPPSGSTATAPAPNAAGWNSSDVTIDFVCADGLSGVLSAGSSILVSTDGAGQSRLFNCQDVAGNITPVTASGLNIDKTAPSIASSQMPPPVSGINFGPVTVTFNCADALSGVASCTAPVTVTAPGVTNVTGTAVDTAGNIRTITHTVTIQPCSYGINPTSQSVSSAGGGGTVTVTTPAGCNWTAINDDSWVSITSASNGSGNGAVTFTVAANSGAARSAILTIAGLAFTVNQDGAHAQPGADLVLTEAALPEVRTGHNLIYLVAVANLGPGSASNVVVTNPLPSGTAFVRAIIGSASCAPNGFRVSCTPPPPQATPCVLAGNTVSCTVGTLAPLGPRSVAGAIMLLEVRVTAPAGASIRNVATVGSSTPDPNAANNSDSATTRVMR